MTGAAPETVTLAQAVQMAVAHHQAGRLPQAEALYQQILKADPNHPEALHFLGVIAKQVGKHGIAVELIGRALAVRPDYAEAHNNLGLTLQERGETTEAVTCFRKALAFNPDYAEACYNLGIALQKQGELDEAANSYRKAVLLKPDFYKAYFNMGVVFREQGKLDEAIESYRNALMLKPDFSDAHSNLLFTLNFHIGATPDGYLAEARRYGSKALDSARPYTNWPICSEMQPLRVGLVSGDLKTHPVGFFLESIIAHLNPKRIELVAYSTTLREDDLTLRLKPHFSSWYSLARLSDAEAAGKIRDDGIHILIDLAGHTARNRLAVFAWKPAPVQVSWLGYFASTGVPGMDYLLTDPISVPAAHQEHFTETVWHLPETRLCFTPPVIAEDLLSTPLPALRNGYITFGCFQGVSKINDGVLTVWARIFQSLPQARLRIQNGQMSCPATRAYFLQRLAQHGIEPCRVSVESKVPRAEYLKAHADVDIILDTFPYPGGTTTCEALWMGVPTLTLAGNTQIARQGACLLTNAGMTDWIAGDADDYVDLAVAHAGDIGRLVQLRSALREKVRVSPLFDAPRFALNLENALYGMWQKKLPASA